MSVFLFITSVYAATPNAANSGMDLIIILCCMGVLIGVVYSIKFLMEKFRENRNRTILENNALDTQENYDN